MTNRCTAKCAHCCMNSGPDRSERLDFPVIRKTIDELNDISPLLTVVFAGGEPTLVKDALRQSIRHCSEIGISTRLVTNASWAKTPSTARRVLKRLKADGLRELNISTDDYHLPFIPFENVVNAWSAAKEMVFDSVVIANSVGPSSQITPECIKKRIGERVPLRFDEDGIEHVAPAADADGTYYAISNSQLQRLERGAATLSDSDFHLMSDISRLNAPCPYAIRNAALSARGSLLACCGFELDGNEVLDFGDVRTTNAARLIEKANNDVIINAIAYFGPLFLMKIVKKVAPDVSFSKKFGSVCEICRSVVKNPDAILALREHVSAFGPVVIRRRMKVAKHNQEAA